MLNYRHKSRNVGEHLKTYKKQKLTKAEIKSLLKEKYNLRNFEGAKTKKQFENLLNREVAKQQNVVCAETTVPQAPVDNGANEGEEQKDLFLWLRSGVNFEEVSSRLNEASSKYPKLAQYFESHLRNTILYWADFARVWHLTFDLTTTALIEGYHSTLKKPLKGKSILPHLLPAFLAKVLEGRKFYCQSNRGMALRNFRQQKMYVSNEMGLKEFVKCLESNIHEQSQQYLLEQAGEALLYEVTKVSNGDIKKVLDDVVKHDRSSGLRFSMLNDVEDYTGTFFKVRRKQAENFHVVHVSKNGGLACSCGDSQSRGAPDRHILAVYMEGGFLFSPRHHIHPAYVKMSAGADFLPISDKNPRLPDMVTPICTWNEAFQITEEPWKARGLGQIGQNEQLKRRRLELDQGVTRKIAFDKFNYCFNSICRNEDLKVQLCNFLDKLADSGSGSGLRTESSKRRQSTLEKKTKRSKND